jgi:hypothetical protein
MSIRGTLRNKCLTEKPEIENLVRLYLKLGSTASKYNTVQVELNSRKSRTKLYVQYSQYNSYVLKDV